MKEKIKKVYYCDFCKRHTLTINSMVKHEKHCTLNPNRICRVCDGEDDDCPMCKFSRIRIGIKNGIMPKGSFDLKEEMAKYWKEKEYEYLKRELY